MSDNKHSVLLIEDNNDAAEVMQTMLAASGIECDWASSLESSERYLRNQYSVIAADYYIEGNSTGAEVIQRYRKYHPTARTVLYTRGQFDDDTNGISTDARLEGDEASASRIVAKIVKCCQEGMSYEGFISEVTDVKASTAKLDAKVDELKDMVNGIIRDRKSEFWALFGMVSGVVGGIVTVSVVICGYFANRVETAYDRSEDRTREWVKTQLEPISERIAKCEATMNGIVPSANAGTLPRR